MHRCQLGAGHAIRRKFERSQRPHAAFADGSNAPPPLQGVAGPSPSVLPVRVIRYLRERGATKKKEKFLCCGGNILLHTFFFLFSFGFCALCSIFFSTLISSIQSGGRGFFAYMCVKIGQLIFPVLFSSFWRRVGTERSLRWERDKRALFERGEKNEPVYFFLLLRCGGEKRIGL
jgi:hypothetical protein